MKVIKYFKRGIYEIWGEGKDYEQLQESITQYQKENFEEHQQKYGHTNWTFRVKVEGYGRKYSQEKQREIMLFFAFMGILENGKVFLKNPDYTFSIVEDVGENTSITVPPRRVFFLRDVAEGVRGLIDLFDVKKRPYIGTTSMDSALSLLVANMAKVLFSTSYLFYFFQLLFLLFFFYFIFNFSFFFNFIFII